MIKVFKLLKNSKIKGYKMKTIRNSVFIGVSLLGGCASVETYFDVLCMLLALKTLVYRGRSALHAQRLYSPYRID